MSMILPVILSGGVGSRLWPLSRAAYPKQFVSLIGEFSLFQQTIQRVTQSENFLPPLIICNEEHRFIVLEQLALLKVEQFHIVLEPEGRNTAPAVAVAAFLAKHLTDLEDPVLLVLSADHLIHDVTAFRQTIKEALIPVQKQKLITFGVKPTRAETGYGYIKFDSTHPQNAYFSIEEFKEKPTHSLAEQYLQEGVYYWNSGMFMFHASCFLKELKQNALDIYTSCFEATQSHQEINGFIRFNTASFLQCREESIDYAVMEKTKNGVVVLLTSDWCDVGSWAALSEHGEADEHNNVKSGQVYLHDVQNSYIYASDRLVAAVGVKDHVIVETKDAVLVVHKQSCQDIKALVAQLKLTKQPQSEHHAKVHRPWGSYETLDRGSRYLVKRIIVKPGASLSLQAHQYRSEHWVVIRGEALVTRGDEQFVLTKDQSTYISCEEKHRLQNASHDVLELIEVQVGDVLEEADIVRFEDNYGRLDEILSGLKLLV